MAFLDHVLLPFPRRERIDPLAVPSESLNRRVKTALDTVGFSGTVALALTLAWLALSRLATIALLIVGECIEVDDVETGLAKALALQCVELSEFRERLFDFRNRNLLC
ncbi:MULTISPECIES: hypothetical protein [unclassified Corynebacterium]|uniref:hypothetical protein n=1 Tax=unclassified Corynebacterium TaxID=2624378 RepID=UPI0022EC61FA|nr:hypothetical protein [Corynebacterium sp. SCR221107]WBT08262.1 hypothetical protein PAB09_10265 [Corynebacterium sp. SCR221107]